MFIDLPADFIVSVSKRLEFQDKLSLSRTCKTLHDLISKSNLYEDLDLTETDTNVEAIVEQFKKNPAHGAQVKTLHIDIEILPDTMVPQLSSVFPNVTNLDTFLDVECDAYNTTPLPEPIATWLNTLEVFNTMGAWYAIWFALGNHTFPRLTALTIEQDDDFTDVNNGRLSASSLLPFIKNAPSLRILRLQQCDITLDLLEGVHASCPDLESLKLSFNAFIIDNVTLPQTIVPAHSVTHLEMDRVLCMDKNGLLLDYIVMKYPNLRYLCFTPQHNPTVVDLKLYYPEIINFSFNNDNTNAGSGGNDAGDMDIDFVEKIQECTSTISTFKSTLEVYRNSAQTFFSSLPKTIHTLKVNIEAFTDIIQILAGSDLKCSKLQIQAFSGSLTGNLEEPHPLSYIKRLTSIKTMEMTLNPSVETWNHQAFASNTVTELTIDLRGDVLYMDWLLSAFPSLETLTVWGPFRSNIRLSDNRTEARSYPNLRKINTSSAFVQQDTIDFLKMATPNVKELDLNTFSNFDPVTKEKTYHLDLSGWDLEKCHLNVHGTGGMNLDRDCKITVDNTTRRFILPSKGDSVRIPGRASVFRQLKNVVRMNIKCDDIKLLRIYGCRVRKVDGEILI